MFDAGDVREFFRRFTGAVDLTDRRTFVRSRVRLRFGERGALVDGELWDVRERCCMVSVGESIFTVAFATILDIVPPSAGEGVLLVVQPGSLACQFAARSEVPASERRGRWRVPAPISAPAAGVPLAVEAARPAHEATETVGEEELLWELQEVS